MSYTLKYTVRRMREELKILKQKKSESKGYEDILSYLGLNTNDYDEEIMKIAFNNCEDEKTFDNEVKKYLEKRHKSISLEKVIIVVEFLNDIAKKRYNTNSILIEKAIKKICLKRTKSGVNSSPHTKYYELVPIVNRTDSFRPWQENHLNDQIKIWVTLENDEDFPLTWTTNDETVITFDNNISINLNSNLNELNMSLEDFLEGKLRLSSEIILPVIKYLETKCITTVEELTKLNDDSWSHFSLSLPSIVTKMRNEIGKFIDKNSLTSNVNVNDNKTDAEKIADWHKTERFLYYEAEMDELKELGYLSREALDLALEEQKNSKSFNGGPILSQIKQAFEAFTFKPNNNIVLSHGMLMYGPPGTGKTSLINVIIKKVGLKELVAPFASTELNRGIVGETEKLIRDIVRRGLTYPYLLCCVAIDEIDAIVPKREGSSSNQRIDSLTQFLTLIGGVDDVKNVYIIGATNRFNKIDDAFLRRLGDKFYVGNLRKDERFKILEGIGELSSAKLNTKFLYDYQELIQVLTTNFSGAAISALRSHMLQFIEMKKNPVEPEKEITIEIDEMVKLIDKCASSFKVKFGGLTLAELIKSIQPSLPNSDRYSLDSVRKQWLEYDEKLKNSTGRVLIDLNQDVLSIQFELKSGELFELSLKDKINNIRFLTDIVPLLMFLCAHLEIEYVKFIDTHFKILQGAEEKSSTLSLILDCFTDFDNYDNGLLCFDGDTIIGVNDSGKIEDALTGELSQSINDQDVWKNCVLHIFRTIVQYSQNEIHPWCILSTSHKFLVDSFKSSLRFPLTIKEKEEQENDKNSRETEIECKNCKKLYYEKDNGLESCSYHPDYLVNLKGDLSVRITNEQLMQVSRNQKSYEIFKEYAWYCCMKGFDSDGCKKNKHSEKSKKAMQLIRKKDKLNFQNEFYTIKSLQSEKYLSSDFDSLSFDKSSIEKNEYFKLIEFEDNNRSVENKYLIKSLSNDKYLTIDETAEIVNLNKYSSDTKGNVFVIANLENDIYEIKSYSNNQYLKTKLDNDKLNIDKGSINISQARKFIIKASNVKIEPGEDEDLYINLANNIYSIQSNMNKRYISVENAGYSYLKAGKYTVENEAELFQFIPVNSSCKAKNVYLLYSLLTKKYVSLNAESKKLTANEKDPTNVYALFKINVLKFDETLCSISIGNKYLSNKKSAETIRTLNVDAEYFDENEFFRIHNQNSFSFFKSQLTNYIQRQSDLTKGYFHIKLEKYDKYVYLKNKKQNNRLFIKTDNKESSEIFKFFLDQNGYYEIKAKSNDLFVCVSENGELSATSYGSLLENKFKIILNENKCLSNVHTIESIKLGKYLDYDHKMDNLTVNSTEQTNLIVKIEKANIFSTKSEDILKNLTKCCFRIQSYVNNEYISLDKEMNLLITSKTTSLIFEFENSLNNLFKLKVDDKFINLEDNKLELAYNSSTFFQIKILSFQPMLISLQLLSSQKYVGIHHDNPQKHLKADAIEVCETEIFRL